MCPSATARAYRRPALVRLRAAVESGGGAERAGRGRMYREHHSAADLFANRSGGPGIGRQSRAGAPTCRLSAGGRQPGRRPLRVISAWSCAGRAALCLSRVAGDGAGCRRGRRGGGHPGRQTTRLKTGRGGSRSEADTCGAGAQRVRTRRRGHGRRPEAPRCGRADADRRRRRLAREAGQVRVPPGPGRRVREQVPWLLEAPCPGPRHQGSVRAQRGRQPAPPFTRGGAAEAKGGRGAPFLWRQRAAALSPRPS